MDFVTIYIIAGILILPVFIYGMISQSNVHSTFEKYSQVTAGEKPASEVAHELLTNEGVTNIDIVRINGKLTDCYNSKHKVIKLSSSVFDSNSISAIGVAAHEAGHAVQDAKKNLLFRLRQIIIPVTNFINRAFIPLIFIGAILNYMFFLPAIGYYITLISVILYGSSLLVSLVTLPLEYDASKKALAMLKKAGFSENELSDSKKVLKAAIHTYISSMLTSLLYFMRFLSLLMLLNDRRK